MEELFRKHRLKIILGAVFALLFIPFYISTTTRRDQQTIQNTACPNLTSAEICVKNTSCKWDKGMTLCCGKNQYATTDSFGSKICCKTGAVCD